MALKIKHQKTFSNKAANVEKKWYLINAEGLVLGRLATKTANILRGKNKANYTPHIDSGDFVVVINADKIKATGSKTTKKTYNYVSGYPGGVKTFSLAEMLRKNSCKVVLEAVRGMLPHNRLGRKQLTKCKVFKGPEHNLTAQKPVEIKL